MRRKNKDLFPHLLADTQYPRQYIFPVFILILLEIIRKPVGNQPHPTHIPSAFHLNINLLSRIHAVRYATGQKRILQFLYPVLDPV